MENIKSNEDITDITEVLETTYLGSCSDTDVSEYKWKLVSDNQNEPTKVHFYKEDMNDVLTVSLSSVFDMWLRHYKVHLVEEEEWEDRINPF